MRLLLCVALKEEEEGDGDTRHIFAVKKIPATHLIFSFF